MQARRIQGLKYQLNHQIASKKKAMYILIGITACVIDFSINANCNESVLANSSRSHERVNRPSDSIKD